jgi:hypothetical protein
MFRQKKIITNNNKKRMEESDSLPAWDGDSIWFKNNHP